MQVRTIAELPFAAAAEYPDRPALRFRGADGWQSRSFRELADTVRGLARGLIGAGVEPGDRVCILAETRPEWTYAGLAVLAAGAVVVPIYPSSSVEECAWVVGNSGARLVIAESTEQLAKIDLDRTLTFDDLMAGPPAPASDAPGLSDVELDRRLAAIDPAEGCVIIYTSGTTGPPKGCVITHRNWLALCDMTEELSYLGPEDVIYLFLPLAHVFAQIVQFASLYSGAELVYFGGDVRRVVAELAEVRPTFLPSVPRIFEKVYTAFAGAVDPAWLAATVRSTLDARRAGREVPPEAEPLFAKVRATFGGRLRLALSGAAPISPAVLEFFHAAGVPVLEGYGMTETTGIGTVNLLDHHRLGKVGVASPGTRVAIAPDGEILMSGPHVFAGYWRDASATADILVDGWVHTGDLGEIDEDGFVAVTGRKKDIIITSGGKNIAPANLENELRQSRWISHAVVFGDSRPYPVVLITLDAEEILPWAREAGLPEDLATLAAHPRVHELIGTVVDEANAHHSHAAQAKRFAILTRDLSQATGELTPTLKVKRRAVFDNHTEALATLYTT